MKSLIYGLIVIVVTCGGVFSQSSDEVGCATEESKALNFLVGTWNVKSRFRISRQEESWEETEGISMIRHVFKDCVYRELLTGKRGGRFHQFTGMYSYNNISRKLQWVGGHSEHGLLTLYEGGFEDDVLILRNEVEIRDRKIYFRRVIKKTADGFTIRSERSADGLDWDNSWTLEYYKK